MARLEFITFTPHYVEVETSELLVKASVCSSIPNLPQLFWNDGTAWIEANLWALERLSDARIDFETVKRTMKHLRKYAEFLETKQFDWRHFPIRKDEQPLRKFRRWLLEEMNESAIALSTASNCMAAVIQFYRYADANELVEAQLPMWQDRVAVIPLYDSMGFKRMLPNVKRFTPGQLERLIKSFSVDLGNTPTVGVGRASPSAPKSSRALGENDQLMNDLRAQEVANRKSDFDEGLLLISTAQADRLQMIT